MASRGTIFTLFIIPMMCYRCYGGWQREALDWGMIGAMGTGAYFFSQAEPFFERPLISGPGDKPYKEEQVPNSWLIGASFGMIGLVALLPNQDGWMNNRSYQHLKGSMQAAASSYLLKEFIKDLVGRPRPDYYDRMELGVDLDEARKSWPSGHATHAANVAAYLALFTWDEWRSDDALALAAKSGITALLAAGAGWVCWTRVADNRHYPGDVIAGSILGAGTALLAYSWQQWWGVQDSADTLGVSGTTSSLPPFSIGLRFSF